MALSPRTAIERLFSCGGPADIAGFVVPIVVGPSVQGMPWARPSPHVSHEGQEIVAPCSADANAASTITGISLRARKIAAAFHALPDAIFRADLAWISRARRFAMFELLRSSPFASKASATLGASNSQPCAVDNNPLPTIASTDPARLIGWAIKRISSFYGEATEFLTDQINQHISHCITRRIHEERRETLP
jgi:hypothetical protein